MRVLCDHPFLSRWAAGIVSVYAAADDSLLPSRLENAAGFIQRHNARQP